MTIKPIAIGMEIPPISTALKSAPIPGKTLPINNPAAIAKKIQAANQRSRNDIEPAARGVECSLVRVMSQLSVILIFVDIKIPSISMYVNI
ncbi:hypothetical protein KaCgl_19860 [Corynebacterium glutamicum]|nr:hypothetical protein KaCgl_19860 [Corynebacterium glutamicum]